MGGTAAFYTYTTYMQKFLRLSVGLSDIQTTMVSGGAPDFRAIPPAALWRDFGPDRPEMASDFLRRMRHAVHDPAALALVETKSAFTAFLLIAAAWLIVSGYTSINAVVKAELFPTNVRATGVGVPYALTVSIFGGTTDPIALWFKSIGHEAWFSYYLTGIIALSLTVYVTMRDTKKHSAIQRHD